MNWSIEFAVPGIVRGKGRPRFTKTGHCYTPKQTTNYETAIVVAFKNAVAARRKQGTSSSWPGPNLCALPWNGPVHLEITDWRLLPKSAPKKLRELVIGPSGVTLTECLIPCLRRPDLDNVLKGVMDALNKVAWRDDAQIWAADIHRIWTVGEEHIDVRICFEEITT